MQLQTKLALIGTLSFALYGCGSGSEAESNEQGPADVEPEDIYLSSIEGVREILRGEGDTLDQSYVSISKTGLIKVYDYQGDAAGTGENCYTYATNAEQWNSMLHLAQISYVFVEELPQEFYDNEYASEENFRLPEENTRFTITSHESVGDFEIHFNSSQYSRQLKNYNYENIYYTSGLGVIDNETGYNFIFQSEDGYAFMPGDLLESDLEASMCSE